MLADGRRPSCGWTAGRRTRTCAGKVAVSREKDCRTGRSPSCHCPAAQGPPPPSDPGYLFSPPTFSVAGKSSEVVKLTSGQALVSSVSEHHSERQGAGSQSRVPGREAGWVQCGIASSSQSLQRNEPRGRRPKYTWRTGRQTLGGAHSQIVGRASPAHKSAGTRRDFTLPPPPPPGA